MSVPITDSSQSTRLNQLVADDSKESVQDDEPIEASLGADGKVTSSRDGTPIGQGNYFAFTSSTNVFN